MLLVNFYSTSIITVDGRLDLGLHHSRHCSLQLLFLFDFNSTIRSSLLTLSKLVHIFPDKLFAFSSFHVNDLLVLAALSLTDLFFPLQLCLLPRQSSISRNQLTPSLIGSLLDLHITCILSSRDLILLHDCLRVLLLDLTLFLSFKPFKTVFNFSLCLLSLR